MSQARIAATETRQRELEELVRAKEMELTKITTDFQYNLKVCCTVRMDCSKTNGVFAVRVVSASVRERGS